MRRVFSGLRLRAAALALLILLSGAFVVRADDAEIRPPIGGSAQPQPQPPGLLQLLLLGIQLWAQIQPPIG